VEEERQEMPGHRIGTSSSLPASELTAAWPKGRREGGDTLMRNGNLITADLGDPDTWGLQKEMRDSMGNPGVQKLQKQVYHPYCPRK
jgi:hypothetical protein